MELNVTFHGGCPAPFYDASLFPHTGGYIDGRLCAPSNYLPGDPTCCLPCPATYWTYPDSFTTYNTVAAWLNVAGFILLFFLLSSYLLLPVQKTRSHYLSVCLIVAVLFLNLGFIVPLGAQPDQCFNEITPNDMYSSITCAWSGAFIIAGGLSGAVWILIRALSMHLQICWDIIPAQRFFYMSQLFGWGVPAVLFAMTLAFTGVSFRFGSSCHVNHDNSMQTFWGWLLAIAAMAVVVQLATFGYCIHVFITNLWSDGPKSQASQGSLPAYSESIRTQTAKAIWRRLKSVLYLQWRGILIVTITLVDVIFFAVVFVYLDDLESSLVTDYARAGPWLTCLVMSGGDKTKCLNYSEQWLLKEAIVGAVLIMLSLIGLELFCLLFRWSLISGWKEFFMKKLSRKQEFVSLDALGNKPSPELGRSYGANGLAFELQKPKEYAYDSDAKTFRPVVTTHQTPRAMTQRPAQYESDTPEPGLGDYHFKSPFADQHHQSPDDSMVTRFSTSSSVQMKRSLSNTRVPSNGTMQSMGWDPTTSYANSGPVAPHASHHVSEEHGFPPGQAL